LKIYNVIPFAILVVYGASVQISRADTIFTDFSSSPTAYNAGSGWALNAAENEVAAPFTPGSNYDLTQIDVAIGQIVAGGVQISLNADSGGVPGAAIESWTITSLPAFGTCCAIETVTPVGTVPLVSGQQYWIVAAPILNSFDAWNLNSTGATGTVAFHGSGWFAVPGEPDPAYDVLGNPVSAVVPEPMTMVLGGTGLLALAYAGRRRLFGRQSEAN
jgi:hypothetical protein